MTQALHVAGGHGRIEFEFAVLALGLSQRLGRLGRLQRIAHPGPPAVGLGPALGSR